MYRREPISPQWDLSAFDSTEPELDEWLREHAYQMHRKNRSKTSVWVDDSGAVMAYYSLAAHKVVKGDLPGDLIGTSRESPAALLAKLALHRSLHDQGYGGALLAEAMRDVVEATVKMAVQFVVVDALHEEAATFYERYEFRRPPGALRLVRPRSSIAADLGME